VNYSISERESQSKAGFCIFAAISGETRIIIARAYSDFDKRKDDPMRILTAIASFLRRNKHILALSLGLGLACTLAVGASTKGYAEEAQAAIAGRVIRFHVLANSNSAADQALKLKVRDAILAACHGGLAVSGNLEQTRSYLNAHLNDIQQTAAETIRSEGYSYPVTVKLCEDYFPTKAYGDITFPPGEYEALRVEIGAAQGNNWWCVMFPPLCYVDITQGKLDQSGKDELKGALPDDSYNLVEGQSAVVKVKFKIVEWWQEHMRPGTANEEAKAGE